MALIVNNILDYTYDSTIQLATVSSSNQTYNVAKPVIFSSNENFDLIQFKLPFDFQFSKVVCMIDDYNPAGTTFQYTLTFYKNTFIFSSIFMEGAIGKQTTVTSANQLYAKGDILKFTCTKLRNTADSEELSCVLYGSKLSN